MTITVDTKVPVYCTSGKTFDGTVVKMKDDELTVQIKSFKITMRYNYAESRYEADIKGNTINDVKLHLLYLYD